MELCIDSWSGENEIDEDTFYGRWFPPTCVKISGTRKMNNRTSSSWQNWNGSKNKILTIFQLNQLALLFLSRETIYLILLSKKNPFVMKLTVKSVNKQLDKSLFCKLLQKSLYETIFSSWTLLKKTI